MTSSPAGSDIVACLLLRLAGRGPRVAGRGRLGRGAAHGLLRHRRLTMPELPLLLQLGYPPSASARNASARADEHQGRQRSFGAVWSSAVGGESRRGRRGDGHAERLAPDEHAPGADLEVDVRRDVVVLVPWLPRRSSSRVAPSRLSRAAPGTTARPGLRVSQERGDWSAPRGTVPRGGETLRLKHQDADGGRAEQPELRRLGPFQADAG
jgi:hypothetical protein